MIKVLFLKEGARSEIIPEIETILDEFGILNREQPNEYRNSEFNYQIIYNDNLFYVGISIRTFNNVSSVIVELDIPEELDIKSDAVFDFKREIKSAIMKMMDKCYWIEDKQMLALSKDAYESINKAENLFRSFILNYMINMYGGNWIESIASELKGSIKDRKSDLFIESIVDLKDVNLDLYSLYINDLTSIVENEYSVDANIHIKLRKELNALDSDGYKDIVKFIHNNIKSVPTKSIQIKNVDKVMFWEDGIGKYFDDSKVFKEKWSRVCSHRNHVAHNKVIDKNMYEIINADVIEIIQQVEKAIFNLNNSIQTEEDKEYINNYDKAIRKMDLAVYGASIYDKAEIEEKLDMYFEELNDDLDDLFYFIKGFEYSLETCILNEGNDIIKVKNLITGDIIRVYVKSFYIDDSDGGQSEVTIGISSNNINDEGIIIIENAASEFDENTGTYIPYTTDRLDDSYLIDHEDEENKIIKSIKLFINNQPNLNDVDFINEENNTDIPF